MISLLACYYNFFAVLEKQTLLRYVRITAQNDMDNLIDENV